MFPFGASEYFRARVIRAGQPRGKSLDKEQVLGILMELFNGRDEWKNEFDWFAHNSIWLMYRLHIVIGIILLLAVVGVVIGFLI